MNYLQLREKVKSYKTWTEAELNSNIRLAQLWHNPLNYSNGDDIKEQYGFESLFSDFMNRRYYFGFHEVDMTDIEVVMRAFRSCSNWGKYTKIWRDEAPVDIAHEAIYLLAVSEMSVKGFKHEAKVAKEYELKGYTVEKSTPVDDLKGVDLWVNGKPVQVKSPATARNMERADGR